MFKFKVGDKVVYYKNMNQSKDRSVERDEYLGKSFTITKITPTPHLSVTHAYNSEDVPGFWFAEDELVKEEIYHSPLYKALT